jgi:glycerophosphoryl diester phosphodiesterase
MTPQRANGGATWGVAKIIQEIRRPHHDLVIVTAHRGSWEYCPENTIEGAMLAMDKQAEAVELDIRVSSDGVPYLTHDYDLRGEAKLDQPPVESTNNLIYALASSALHRRWKVNGASDRKGLLTGIRRLCRFSDGSCRRSRATFLTRQSNAIARHQRRMHQLLRQ